MIVELGLERLAIDILNRTRCEGHTVNGLSLSIVRGESRDLSLYARVGNQGTFTTHSLWWVKRLGLVCKGWVVKGFSPNIICSESRDPTLCARVKQSRNYHRFKARVGQSRDCHGLSPPIVRGESRDLALCIMAEAIKRLSLLLFIASQGTQLYLRWEWSGPVRLNSGGWWIIFPGPDWMNILVQPLFFF